MRRHWYFITYTECPVCGRSKVYRERRYDRRPRRREDRSQFEPDNLCASADVAWDV